jgi:NADPH-dependent glutamate synthase beta subunit-like oxidoreductase
MLEILESTYTKDGKRPTHNMEDFPISQRDTSSNLTGSWRTLLPVFQEGVAPCSQACPAQPYIPKYMGLVRKGKLKEALDIIREGNPLPAVCGRVCPHFCEGSCNRGEFDEQVSVHMVERFIGDYGLDIPHQKRTANIAGKVAVIGSGPAGLSASYFLARQGVVVDLYEREAKAGGLLRYGIPEYRLPRDVLDREIENIFALGINFLNKRNIVPDDLPSLIEKYDFIFYSPGLWGRNIPQWEYSGEKVFDGLDVLKEIHKGMPPLGEKVAVVGGGSTAMDVARVLTRYGKEVTIVYRRTLVEAPAFVDEIQETVEEGIQILEKKLITRIEDQSGGSLMIEIQGALKRADGEIFPDGEKTHRIIDSVVAAVGQIPEIDLEKNTKVFFGGDYETGEGTVVHAIASGKKGASAILRKMGILNKDETEESSTRAGRFRPNKIMGYDDLNPAYFRKSKRLEPNKQDCETRTGNFCEIEPQASKEEIIAEADRCLSCGTCTLCETCWYFCPDACVTTNLNGPRKINFDKDFCKGCAVCSVVCPRGCIIMVEEQ